MRCVMPIMSYAKMDSQCDKLVMVVGRTMLTTLEMIDVQWQKVGKIGFISEFCRSSKESTLIMGAMSITF